MTEGRKQQGVHHSGSGLRAPRWPKCVKDYILSQNNKRRYKCFVPTIDIEGVSTKLQLHLNDDRNPAGFRSEAGGRELQYTLEKWLIWMPSMKATRASSGGLLTNCSAHRHGNEVCYRVGTRVRSVKNPKDLVEAKVNSFFHHMQSGGLEGLTSRPTS